MSEKISQSVYRGKYKQNRIMHRRRKPGEQNESKHFHGFQVAKITKKCSVEVRRHVEKEESPNLDECNLTGVEGDSGEHIL